jgi:hypothetical protein
MVAAGTGMELFVFSFFRVLVIFPNARSEAQSFTA